MQIRYVSILIVCLSIQLQAAGLKSLKTSSSKLYEVTPAEFHGHPKTPNALLLHGIYNEDKAMFATALFDYASPHICYGRDKNPVLTIAAQHTTDPRFVEWLLEEKADINERNRQGQTALMAAAAKGSGIITEYLLKHKADASVVDSNNNTALTQAVFYRNLCSFKHLAVHPGADLHRGYGEGHSTVLVIASRKGNADMVAVLLSLRCNPFTRNKRGVSALDLALEVVPKTEEEALKFQQTIKIFKDYARYSREIYKAEELKEHLFLPLTQIVASYLAYKEC